MITLVVDYPIEIEWQDDIKLPPRIEILLKPVNLHTWGKVQNLAQNPRVKVTLPIQRRVYSLIKTLQRKWKPQDLKIQSSSQPSTSCHHSPVQKIFKKSQIEQENLLQNANLINNNNEEFKIKILPPPGVTIHRPMVNLTEMLSSNRICLNAYEDRIGVKVKGETLWSDRSTYLKELKSNMKRQRHDSASDTNKKSPDIKKHKLDFDIRPLEPCVKLEKIVLDASNATCSIKSLIEDHDILIEDGINKCDNDKSFDNGKIKIETQTIDPVMNDKINLQSMPLLEDVPQILEDCVTVKEDKPAKKKERNYINKKKDLRKESTIFRPLISEESIQKIRDGWTLSTIGDMTFGDLYIMFGSDLKLYLEYSFVDGYKIPETICSSVEISSNISISNTNIIEVKNINLQRVDIKEDKDESLIGNKLKQLLLIANLTEQKKKRQYCGCGHVCDRPNTVTSRTKKCDETLGSFVSTKTHFTSQNDNNIFRPPAAPIRSNLPVIDFKINNNRASPKQPKWIKLRNRAPFPTKQVVVQRTLPLQPGMESSYDTVKLGNITNVSTDRKGKSNASQMADITKKSEIVIIQEDSNKTNDINELANKTNNMPVISEKPSTSSYEEITPIVNDVAHTSFPDIPDIEISQNSFLRNLNENPGFKSLMEISLPSPVRIDCEEQRYEVAPTSTPPMSPMKLLREIGDCQNDSNAWLTPDFNDFSYSSFLGHLESFDSRNGRPKSRNSDDANLDSSNLSIISETTVDYVTKFAQIAEDLKEQGNL